MKPDPDLAHALSVLATRALMSGEKIHVAEADVVHETGTLRSETTVAVVAAIGDEGRQLVAFARKLQGGKA